MTKQQQNNDNTVPQYLSASEFRLVLEAMRKLRDLPAKAIYGDGNETDPFYTILKDLYLTGYQNGMYRD